MQLRQVSSGQNLKCKSLPLRPAHARLWRRGGHAVQPASQPTACYALVADVAPAEPPRDVNQSFSRSHEVDYVVIGSGIGGERTAESPRSRCMCALNPAPTPSRPQWMPADV